MGGSSEGWSRLHPSTVALVAPMLCANTKSPTATNLFYFLYAQSYMHNNRICLSYGHIAEKMEVGYKAARNAALALKELGLIKINSRKGTNGGTVFSLSEEIYQAILPTNSNATPSPNRSKGDYLEKSKEHSMESNVAIEWGDGDPFNRSRATDNLDGELENKEREGLDGERIGACPQCGAILDLKSSAPGMGYCKECNTTVKLRR